MTMTSRRPRRNPNARYEVWSGYPHPTRPGTSSQHECRSFERAADAWAYAKALPADREHTTVNITGYYAANGWRGDHIRQRRNGVWYAPYPLPGGTPLSAEQLANPRMR